MPVLFSGQIDLFKNYLEDNYIRILRLKIDLVSYPARAEGLGKRKEKKKGGTRGVMVIVVGNGNEFKSWTRLITFHIALIPLGKV